MVPYRVGGECSPSSTRLVSQLPLRFLCRVCGPWVESFCSVGIICEWIGMCVVLGRESIVFTIFSGVMTKKQLVISTLGVRHASKEYGLRSQRSAPIPALPLPNWEVNYLPWALISLPVKWEWEQFMVVVTTKWDNTGKYMQMMH